MKNLNKIIIITMSSISLFANATSYTYTEAINTFKGLEVSSSGEINVKGNKISLGVFEVNNLVVIKK
jgi:hypothetical protein